MSTKLCAIYQYIDDIIKQTENDDRLLNETYNHYSKKIKEQTKSIFKLTPIIISIGVIISIPTKIYTLSIILAVCVPIILLISYLLQKTLINSIDIAVDYRRTMFFNKIKCFLNIKKQINFYQHSRIDILLKDDNTFTEKVNRHIFWTLYDLDMAFNIFNLDYYKLLYKSTHTTEFKLECIHNYFVLCDKLLKMIRRLMHTQEKSLPFFIQDEIHLLFKDNLKYIPKYYMQPDAKIQPYFDISSDDFIQLQFGGVFQMYKNFKYSKVNHLVQSLHRKKIFIDKDLNVLEIK